MAGFTGTALTNGIFETNDGSDVDADSQVAYLRSISDLLDVDGNGAGKPLTDGILLLRFLAEFTGDALIDEAVDTVNGTRTTAAAVINHLQPAVPVQAQPGVQPRSTPPVSTAPTSQVRSAAPQPTADAARSAPIPADRNSPGTRPLDLVFQQIIDPDEDVSLF